MWCSSGKETWLYQKRQRGISVILYESRSVSRRSGLIPITRSTMDGGDQPPVDGASTRPVAAICASEDTGKAEATPVPASSCAREDTGKAEATPVPESSEAVGSSCGDSESCEALARAISATLGSVIIELDSRAEGAARSQDELVLSIDRLTRELDKLLEDAPLPFIMQHAAKISSIHKRVSGLNLLLKSVQRRVDNIDRILSTGIPIDKARPDIVETSSFTL